MTAIFAPGGKDGTSAHFRSAGLIMTCPLVWAQLVEAPSPLIARATSVATSRVFIAIPPWTIVTSAYVRPQLLLVDGRVVHLLALGVRSRGGLSSRLAIIGKHRTSGRRDLAILLVDDLDRVVVDLLQLHSIALPIPLAGMLVHFALTLQVVGLALPCGSLPGVRD